MSDDSTDQLRFGDEGELKEATDEESSTDNLKDDGDPMGRSHDTTHPATVNTANANRTCESKSAIPITSGCDGQRWEIDLPVSQEKPPTGMRGTDQSSSITLATDAALGGAVSLS